MVVKKLLSNTRRCVSLTTLSVEIEVNERLGVGTDPLELLIKLEDTDGEVRLEVLELINPVGD